MWIKCLVNQSFAVCVFGQMIAAIGQPFLTNSPAKVSALWFSEKGVSYLLIICIESNRNYRCYYRKSTGCSDWILDSCNIRGQ